MPPSRKYHLGGTNLNRSLVTVSYHDSKIAVPIVNDPRTGPKPLRIFPEVGVTGTKRTCRIVLCGRDQEFSDSA